MCGLTYRSFRSFMISLIAVFLAGFCVQQATAADYFPLAVGNSWTYYPSYGDKGYRLDTIAGTEEVNGTFTYIWNRQEAPDDNYNEKRWYAKDGTYLSAYKFWDNDGINQVLTTPWDVLKLNPVVGDTWTFEDDFGSIHAEITVYVESVSDTMTVSAGTFTSCIRIRELTVVTDDGATETDYKKKWYAPGVGLIVDRKYTDNWGAADFSQELVSYSVTSTQTIGGTITYNGAPVCAMVLANGKYAFTCSGDGRFTLTGVPLDTNDEITLFVFCNGLAPYKTTLTEGTTDLNIALSQVPDSQKDKAPVITVTSATESTIKAGWVDVSGTIENDSGTPLCCLVLANGQFMFTCNPVGEFALTVPMDANGRITLQGFCSGLLPSKITIEESELPIQ